MRSYLGVPDGTRDRVYADAEALRERENALAGLFAARGYREACTPMMEYYDLFVQTGSPLRQEAMQSATGRNGRILVLRPDSTVPLARAAATRLATQELPLRLYACQSVCRSDISHNGRSAERRQAGVELLGAPGLKADLEVLALALETLQACASDGDGKRCRLEIGHAGLFDAMLACLDVDEATAETIRQLTGRKNYAALDGLLDGLSGGRHADALRRILLLFGGPEILREAGDLGNPASNAALAYLRELYEGLRAAGFGEHVLFDLGLVGQLGFYTGVIFHGYAENLGEPALSGGRYDNLLGQLGREAAATGFAVSLDAFPSPEEGNRCLQTVIHYEVKQTRAALALLRAQPPGSAELSVCGSVEESAALAARKGCRLVVVGLEPHGE